MSCYQTFLKEHKLPKDSELKPTHTRIGDKDLGIFGGSYYIPRKELKEFYELYADHVFVNQNKEYLTEKQTQDILAVDLDFKYDATITTRQHTISDIKSLILTYMDVINEFCDTKNGFLVFVMEKPNVNILEDITKDGIHLIFYVKIDRDTQLKIRKRMVEMLSKEDSCLHHLPIINKNKWEDVLDIGITKGSTNWQLYGSRKPGHEAYELTNVFTVNESHEVREDRQQFNCMKANQGLFLSCFSVQNDDPYIKSAEKRVQNNKRSADEINDDDNNNNNKLTIHDDDRVRINGLTKEEDLLFMIRIDPKDRPVWL